MDAELLVDCDLKYVKGTLCNILDYTVVGNLLSL